MIFGNFFRCFYSHTEWANEPGGQEKQGYEDTEDYEWTNEPGSQEKQGSKDT